jgi:hypothetical protein
MASSVDDVRTVLRRPAFSRAVGNKVRVPRRCWATWTTVTLCEYPCVITSSTIAGTGGLCIRLLFGQNSGVLCTFCCLRVIARFVIVTNASFMKCIAPFDRNEYLENQTAQIVCSVTIPTFLYIKMTLWRYCGRISCVLSHVIAFTDYFLLIE